MANEDKIAGEMMSDEELDNVAGGTFGGASVGIEAEFNGVFDNTYKLNGREITQEEARWHAMDVTKHYMVELDWKW